jgi:hypothetical protein
MGDDTNFQKSRHYVSVFGKAPLGHRALSVSSVLYIPNPASLHRQCCHLSFLNVPNSNALGEQSVSEKRGPHRRQYR